MDTHEQKLQIVYRQVEDLIPYEKNSRTHSEEQIEKVVSSIKEFGWTNPILIDEDQGIIAGHGRLEAAKRLGMKEVPVLVLTGLTEAQKRAYIIADNKLALEAGWDEDLLREELDWLTQHDYSAEVTGFDSEDLQSLLSVNLETAAEESEAIEEPEDEADTQQNVPEIQDAEIIPTPPAPKSRPKDLWILGTHRLMCGDSTNEADVARLMGGGRANLYLTDPPYNVAYKGKTKDALTIKNDKQDDAAFKEFLVRAFKAADLVLMPGGVFYIWHADSEGLNFRSSCKDVGWAIRECLIWSKNTMVLGRQDYQWKHEPCLYGWKDGAAHAWYSDRTQTTVLQFDKPTRNAAHPTMKPVPLFAYLIQNSSKEGDIVLDSFGGSGTTIIACEGLKRQARVMELDPAYCDVIIRRWQDSTGLQAVREDGVLFDDIEQPQPQ